MHPNTLLLFERYARSYFRPHGRVLDFGPDRFPTDTQAAVNDATITWETADIRDDARLTLRMPDEYTLPTGDNQYDVVLATNVLEHVRKPWVWLKELVRVCKPGGHVITINPVSWPFHEAPVDCWRAYPDGMRALYEEAGLETLLSKYESLEAPGFSRYIQGRSWHWLCGRTRAIYQVAGRLGFPVERAYDTITIGRKPE